MNINFISTKLHNIVHANRYQKIGACVIILLVTCKVDHQASQRMVQQELLLRLWGGGLRHGGLGAGNCNINAGLLL